MMSGLHFRQLTPYDCTYCFDPDTLTSMYERMICLKGLDKTAIYHLFKAKNHLNDLNRKEEIRQRKMREQSPYLIEGDQYVIRDGCVYFDMENTLYTLQIAARNGDNDKISKELKSII